MVSSKKAKAESVAKVEIRNLSPKDAAELLESNEVNRNIRSKLVNAYRADMEAGRWSFTAEPVQISRTGRLLNGQHRLTALAGAKGVVGLDFVVATGLTDESQAVMDQGAPRSIKDALILTHGHIKNVTVASGVTRWLCLVPNVGPEMNTNDLRNRKVTAAEAMETFTESGDEIVLACQHAVAVRDVLFGSPTATAYTWLQLARVDEEKATEFFHGMIDMEFALGNDPRKAAMRRLQALHREEKTSLETGVILVSVLTRAWNDWRQGKQVETYLTRSRFGVIAPVKPI